MTCQKCASRSFVKDISGVIACIACGQEAGVAVRPRYTAVKTCSKGHPMPDGPPCWPCKDALGRSSPSVRPKFRQESPAIFPAREIRLVRAPSDRRRAR